MPRLVRHAVPALVPVIVAIALAGLDPAASLASVRSAVPGPQAGSGPAAVVDWPPSSSLVLSEVMTGGASASDEFVELYNAGASDVDLAGLEVAYVTSTGGTITRKATWATTTTLAPRRHILLANGAGIHAATADVVYTGGLSATGGAMVVRVVGGTTIDAVGWGDASNPFVEGAAASAPSAGSSIERRPGGSAGNGIDTNDGAADWLVNASPTPQNLASPPTPSGASPGPTVAPTPTLTPTPTVAPTPTLAPTPAPTSIPTPSASPTPVPTAAPTATPGPTFTPGPTPTVPPTPTVAPTATATSAPSPTPTPGPTSTPIPTPTVAPTPVPTDTPVPSPTPDPGTSDIGDTRGLAIGTRVRVAGVVTVELGRIVDDRTFAIQDATGAILVRVDGSRRDSDLARGTSVVVEGQLASRYGALEVRLDDDDALEVVGLAALPAPLFVDLSALGEDTEAMLVEATGLVVDVDHAKSGTTTIMVEDESGTGRVVAFAGAGDLPVTLERQVTVDIVGIGGQRSTGKDRVDGYRIWLRDGADLVIRQVSPSPGASGSPSPKPSVVPISAARKAAGVVSIEGVVTSPTGMLDADGRRVTVEDATAAILLRLADDQPNLPVGRRIRVTGRVGTYYGAPQFAATGPAESLGNDPMAPTTVGKAPKLGVEWQLVRARGTVVEVRRSGDTWRAELRLSDGGRVPIVGLARAGIDVDRIGEGRVGSIVGIVRRAYPTAIDRRFAILPRSAGDLDLTSSGDPAGDDRPASSTDREAGGSGADAAAQDRGSSSDGSSVGGLVLVTAATLPDHLGRLVRLGGLVVDVGRDVGRAVSIVVIEDASGLASLTLPAELDAVAGALKIGDLVEGSGIAQASPDGWSVELEGASDLVVAGQTGDSGATGHAGAEAVDDVVVPADLSSTGPSGSSSTVDAASPMSDPTSVIGTEGAAQPAVEPLLGLAGMGGLLGVLTVTAATGAWWRRRRFERLFSKAATDRLVEHLSPRTDHAPRLDAP